MHMLALNYGTRCQSQLFPGLTLEAAVRLSNCPLSRLISLCYQNEAVRKIPEAAVHHVDIYSSYAV